MNQYDIIIIGAGPGGLTAGIYAGRQGTKTLILDKDLAGGLGREVPEMENYPGFDNISGLELIEKIKSQAVKNTAIVGMNTNFANMLGLGNCTDNATIERLVIIKFKPNSDFSSNPEEAQALYRKTVGEFIDQPNFTYSLYRYLKEDMEIPKSFSTERYYGKEKFELLKEAKLHREDDPKEKWFNDLLENYSYITLEDFKNGFDKGQYQLCESTNKTTKIRYVVQKREWYVKSYRAFIDNDRVSESTIIDYITAKGFEEINSRAYGGRVIRINADKFEQYARDLQADIVDDEGDWE